MDVTHDSVNARLSEFVDGELDAADTAVVEAHLFECAECRTTLQDLRAIVAAAGRLPGGLPAQDLWAGITDRITPRVDSRRMRFGVGRWRPGVDARRRVSATLPQLAAAGILLMLLSGGMVFLLRPTVRPASPEVADARDARADDRIAPVSLSDPQYDDAVADLERTLEAGRGRLDPETVRVLERNLATIDAAIEQCRRALEADPANAFLNSHFVSARQRKLALLRQATALTTGS